MPITRARSGAAQSGLIDILDFGGGLNLKSSPYQVAKNQATILTNWYLLEDGSLLGRGGTQQFNAAPIPSNPIQGATRSRVGSTPAWLVYLTLVAPQATPAASAGASGSLSGTYTFEVTFVSALGESAPSPPSASVSVTNQQVNLTNIPTGPAGVTARKIYGFKQGVSTQYQLIATINDNTTTTYTVTTDQGSWGAAPPAPSGLIAIGNDSNGQFSVSLSGLSPSALGTFEQYLKFVYFASQQDAMKKFDGTTWTPAGIAAPTTAPTAAAGASGSLSGTYTFQVTFVTATTESNPSPASASVTVTNQQINLSNIPTGPAGVTQRNIYGFKQGISSVYQFIATINDNTTTTYTVTTDQPSWGFAAPTTNTPPIVGPWILKQWKNRFWAAGNSAFSNRLYFSEIYEPEVWPASYYIDIPFSGADQITAIMPLGDLLIVWGQFQLYYIFGATPFSFVVEQSFAQHGAVSPWAVTRVSNAVVYLSQFGVFSFDGAQETSLSDLIEPQFTGVGTILKPMNYATAIRATMAYYTRLRAIIISFPTIGNTNDTTYWFFLLRRAWVKDSRASGMLLVEPVQGTLWSWDAGSGTLRQWDVGSSDDGQNILKTYQSGAFAGPSVDSTQRYTWITVRSGPLQVPLQVTAYVDAGALTDSIGLTPAGGSKLGSAQLGSMVLSGDIQELQERWIPDLIGRTIQIRIDINDQSQAKIWGISQRFDVITKPRYAGSGL